jgi:hypothetical protein
MRYGFPLRPTRTSFPHGPRHSLGAERMALVRAPQAAALLFSLLRANRPADRARARPARRPALVGRPCARGRPCADARARGQTAVPELRRLRAEWWRRRDRRRGAGPRVSSSAAPLAAHAAPSAADSARPRARQPGSAASCRWTRGRPDVLSTECAGRPPPPSRRGRAPCRSRPGSRDRPNPPYALERRARR